MVTHHVQVLSIYKKVLYLLVSTVPVLSWLSLFCPFLSLFYPCLYLPVPVCPCPIDISSTVNYHFLHQSTLNSARVMLGIACVPLAIAFTRNHSFLWHQDHVGYCWPPSYCFIHQESSLSLKTCLQQVHGSFGFAGLLLAIPSNRHQLCPLHDALN